ncbi:unnamed protein product [Urochloa humidicola]
MQRKGPDALTGTEINAAVYRYLQESGFVHTAFNFFYEAGIEEGNIQGMIPQGALIRIVHKGLHYIELEANSEIGSDDEHHYFDPLELMIHDLDELRKKITSNSQWNSVKNDKEKINSVEADSKEKDSEEQNISSAEIAQKIGSSGTSAMHRKKPTQKTMAAQNRNPDETATIRRTQTKHAKAQGMDSKEQNASSAGTTTGQLWQLSWIGKKPRRRK